MPSLSVILKQTDEVLDDILQIIRHEHESLNSVLSEVDRNRFVEEEESLRERLKETERLESNSWFQNLLGLPSPQAVKRLDEAKELRQRIKGDINAEVRNRATGRSNPPSTSFFGSMGIRTPEEPRSPLANMLPKLNAEPTVQNESYPGGGSPRQSYYVGRPASPLPLSPRLPGASGSPTNSPFTLPAQLPLDPISPVTQHENSVASSPYRQARGWQESRHSDDYVAKTNCVEINGSNVDGLTLNNGGTNNSGAVVHKLPHLSPRHAPH